MKITQEQQKQGQELYQQLVEKAWASATFKEQLINNPEAAIKEVAGFNSNFSSESKFKVEDQTDINIIYLNIPREINVNSLELTDEQLELVSGGYNPFDAIGYAIGYAFGKFVNAGIAYNNTYGNNS